MPRGARRCGSTLPSTGVTDDDIRMETPEQERMIPPGDVKPSALLLRIAVPEGNLGRLGHALPAQPRPQFRRRRTDGPCST
jgi:hypothetical protein